MNVKIKVSVEFSVSDSGTLVYLAGGPGGSIRRRPSPPKNRTGPGSRCPGRHVPGTSRADRTC